MKNEVMITGSFDPVTNGHIDIIKRTAAIFENTAVVMFINDAKAYMFTAEQRLEMLRAACRDIDGVRVDYSLGRVVDYALENGIKTVVRGIRNAADLDYEVKMALYNKENGGVETVFLPAKEELLECSSTMVRKAITEGSTPWNLVPYEVGIIIENIMEQGEKHV